MDHAPPPLEATPDAPPAPDLGDLRGVSLGPFVLDSRLGRGGVGEVWRAHHVHTERAVAVKVLSAGVARDPAWQAQFRQEARSQARIDHASVLRLLDLGTVDDDATRLPAGSPWLATELASGGPLRLDPQGGWPAIRPIVRALLEALAHVHAHGLVHRDLKPRNLLWSLPSDARPGVKIGDFGIAAFLERPDHPFSGTPGYMAPEQLLGHVVDLGPSTDLWALGAVIWEVLTGRLPYPADQPRAAITEPLPEFDPAGACPAEVGPWLHMMLASLPEDRFGCAADALQDLPGTDDEPLVVAVPEPPLPDVGLALVALRELPPFGRDREQAALQAALIGARGGPALVWIAGPDGAGRGHLARWIAREAAVAGSATVFGQGDGPHGWVRGLGRALRLVAATDDEVAERLRGLVSPAATQSATDPETSTQVAVWTSLLRPDHRARGVARVRLERADRRAAVGAALLGALARRHHPVVLVLQDLTHRDAIALAEAVLEQPRPVLVVATGEGPPPDGLVAQAATLTLGPLDEATAEELVQALLPLDPVAAVRVRQAGGGWPGLTAELVRAWAEAGHLVPGPRGWCLVPGAPDALPAQRIEAWRDRMRGPLSHDGLRPALWVAAVLGHEVRESEWQRALQLGEHAWPAAALARVAGHLLTRHADGRWTWANPIARQIALEHAEHAGMRTHIEAWCADSVAHDPGRRGQHLLAADHPAEALDALIRAARQEIDGSGHPQRLAHWVELAAQAARQAALTVADPRRGWLAWLEAWVGVQRDGAGGTQALSAVLDAARHHGWTEVAHRTAIGLARRSGEAGDPHSAEAFARSVLESDDPRLRGLAWLEIGLVAHDSGRYDDAEGALLQSLQCLEPLHDVWLADVHHSLASLYRQSGRLAEAAESNRMAQMWHERAGSAWGAATARTTEGELHRLRGERAEAEIAYREAARRLTALSSPTAAFPLANLGLLRLEAGDWEGGYRALMHAHHMFARRGRVGLAAAMQLSALATLAARDDAEAWDACFDQQVRVLDEAGFADADVARYLALAAGVAMDRGWTARAVRALGVAGRQLNAVHDASAVARCDALIAALS